MAHPVWLPYSFAVVMVAVSLYCIGRLALAARLQRRNHYDVTVSHVLMGFAMVGMLVPRWNVVPDGLWELVFAAMAVYFLVMTLRVMATRRRLAAAAPTGGASPAGAGAGAGAIAVYDGDHRRHPWHPLIHLVMACAMLYMYWLGMPATGGGGIGNAGMAMSGGSAGTGDPGLTLLLIMLLLVSAIWQLDSLTRYSPAALAARVVTAGAPGKPGGAGTAGIRAAGLGAAGTRVDLADPMVSVDQRPWLAPRLEIACHILMCLTMAYMLVVVS